MALQVRRYNFYHAKQHYSQFFTLWLLKGYEIEADIWFARDLQCAFELKWTLSQKTITPYFTLCQKMGYFYFFSLIQKNPDNVCKRGLLATKKNVACCGR